MNKNLNRRDKKALKQKVQQLNDNSRYSKDERSLITNTFLDNDELLMNIRKFFLQGEMLVGEMAVIKALSEDVITLLRKSLLPEIDPEAPFNQAIDLWVSIDTNEKLAEDVYLDMRARLIVIDYLEDQFRRVPDGKPGIWLKDLTFNKRKDKKEAFIDLKARNTILTHIDLHLQELRILAISNSELSPEEQQKKIQMDSSK